jgi:hypothetical protein
LSERCQETSICHVRKTKAVFFAPAGWLAWWRGLLAELLPRCRQLGALAVAG